MQIHFKEIASADIEQDLAQLHKERDELNEQDADELGAFTNQIKQMSEIQYDQDNFEADYPGSGSLPKEDKKLSSLGERFSNFSNKGMDIHLQNDNSNPIDSLFSKKRPNFEAIADSA